MGFVFGPFCIDKDSFLTIKRCKSEDFDFQDCLFDGFGFWQKTGGGAFLDIFFPQTQTSMEGGHYFSFSCLFSKESVGCRWPRFAQTSGHFSSRPFLSSDFTEDMSLCPVRALRYYLDRTSALRKGKNLLFISFKEGFDRDIMRSTFCSWIKQTVSLAYQSSNSESKDLHIKAHDVRSMSASLAFKRGASLEQILGSLWKSHNTFTTFYLKDIAWQILL